jgi:hypothetical protein
MHRNILSWFDDDLVIAKAMVENAVELDNDRGRSGMCSCICSPTVTSFMALNEYENLLASLSLQEKAEDAPRAHDTTWHEIPRVNDGWLPTWEVQLRGTCSHRGRQ